MIDRSVADMAPRRGFVVLAATAVIGATALSTVSATDDSAAAVSQAVSSEEGESPSASKPKYQTFTVRGRVVWLADALARRYGIGTDPDARKWHIALETTDGRLLPIVKDNRGRGFYKDPRIRNIDVELLVRQYDKSPMIQVVRMYTLKADGRYEFDYWCDICSIPLYELKECSCCQGPIRIREQLVERFETKASPRDEPGHGDAVRKR